MSTIYVLSAIPGSGKTTWAERFKAAHPHTFVVSSDAIRLELFGKVDDFSDEPRVWKTFLDRLNEYGAAYEDSNVIADATNLQNRFRIFYAKETPNIDKHVLVLFKLDYELCLKQNLMREKVVPDYAMERMHGNYEEVSEEALSYYDEVIEITEDNRLNGI